MRARTLISFASLSLLAVFAVNACGGEDNDLSNPNAPVAPALSCHLDSECPEGRVCLGGACQVPTQCVSDNQCTSSGKLCNKDLGYCVSCLTDDHCEASQRCEMGACAPVGTGGTGGTGGMGTGAADNCPGVAIDLSPSATIALTGSHTGDTSTLTGSYVGNCGSALAKEAVHSITVPEDGHVRADLGGELTTGFDATLYARSNCAVQSSEVACDDSYEKGGEVIAFEAAAGETYYIFVDGYNVEAGPYTLNVRFLPKGCGNGFVEAGEECDDGNAIDDDWCRNNCTINASPSGDTCPGMVMAMMGSGTQDRVGTLSGNTAYFTPKYASSGCAASSTGPAKDFVAAMTSDVDGTATCDLGGATSTPFDAVLYARSNCTDASSEVACHDSPMSGGEKIVFAVAKDGTYYVFVDGYGTGKAGAFKLTCTIKPAF